MKPTEQTNLFEADTFVEKHSKTKVKAMLLGDRFSDSILSDFTSDSKITGLTNGKFSLISLIKSVLKKTGPANVIISTWSAGFYDSSEIHNLLTSNCIIDFKIILDRSFKTRQEQYSTHLTDLFKDANIRTTNTHAKYVLIYNDQWNICITTSMNLNENKRCENFNIDTDLDVFNLFKDFSDSLFEKGPHGIIESRSVVDPIFDSLFKDEFENGTIDSVHEHQQDEEEKQQQLSSFISIIREIYEPASSTDTATHYFTTEELYNSIKEINPGSQISKDNIYAAMIQSGFIYRTRPGSIGINFRWLLLQK